jgi:4'-phosphopantetheinyl transferase
MIKNNWRTPPEKLSLENDDVHIWRVSLTPSNTPIDLAGACLSPDEQERARRFHFDHDRERFILAHEALRRILAQYLDILPMAIEFGYGEQGKPNLEPLSTPSGLSFNLSHSGDWSLIAIAVSRDIGVDVEQLRPNIDLERIARRFFSSSEVNALFALAPELRLEAFYRCWTRKEAYIKARGGGLSIPLGSLDVALEPNKPAALLAVRDNAENAGNWSLLNIDLDEGYQAALVVEGTLKNNFYWNYSSETYK